MGAKTCRCLYSKDDPASLSLEKTDERIVEGNIAAGNPKLEVKTLNLGKSKAAADNILRVEPGVSLQEANSKENIIFPKLAPELEKPIAREQPENTPPIDSTQRQSFKELSLVPDYSNPETRATENRLGDFKFDPDNDIAGLQTRPPIELDNGAIYIGQWNQSGIREGRGTQLWPDGSKYIGHWKNDMANGLGRLIHADGDVYEGEWVDDKAHGYGMYMHVDGSQYKGEWKDDKQHGYGEEIWSDGAKYEGRYENGKKHGSGYFKWVDGSSYQGEFFFNNIHGKGTYVWNDGRRYEGEWKNNKMDGKGVFNWSDGRSYNGEYKNDKKHGCGEFTWPDGRKYIGNWIDGRQHGNGIYTSTDGKPRKGEWREGKRIRWLPSEDGGDH